MPYKNPEIESERRAELRQQRINVVRGNDTRRICAYEDCSTVLSRYNNNECCGAHQMKYFLESEGIRS